MQYEPFDGIHTSIQTKISFGIIAVKCRLADVVELYQLSNVGLISSRVIKLILMLLIPVHRITYVLKIMIGFN